MSIHLRCVALLSQLSPEYRDFCLTEACRASFECFADDTRMMDMPDVTIAMKLGFLIEDSLLKQI